MCTIGFPQKILITVFVIVIAAAAGSHSLLTEPTIGQEVNPPGNGESSTATSSLLQQLANLRKELADFKEELNRRKPEYRALRENLLMEGPSNFPDLFFVELDVKQHDIICVRVTLSALASRRTTDEVLDGFYWKIETNQIAKSNLGTPTRVITTGTWAGSSLTDVFVAQSSGRVKFWISTFGDSNLKGWGRIFNPVMEAEIVGKEER